MADTTPNKRKCDICNKQVDRWDIASVKRIQYFPGKLYNRCSSDITSHTVLLANLCPVCMEKLENLIELNKAMYKKGERK